jgi:hypothetical protein
LALWIAGHIAVGDPDATEAIREMMLKAHIESVRGMLPIEYKSVIEPQLKRRIN